MHFARCRHDEKELTPALDSVDPEWMTAEERALHEAKRIAQQKAKLTGDALKFSLIAILLLVFMWPVGVVVLIIWGPRHLRELYRLVVEPRLRERFLEEEIEKQVHAQLSEERRALENEHARSLEELSAQVAHEIRNPITAAKSLVQQMEEDPDAAENVEYARVALSELTRVERSVSHLLRYAREEDLELHDVRLGDVVESALAGLRDRIDAGGVCVKVEVSGDALLRADAEKLRRVLINLAGNALDALAERRPARPVLEVVAGENLAGTECWVRVRDNGSGIEADALAKIWSPFYTSKAAGTGLGLAISRKVVEAHGGTLEVESEPGTGSEFTLTIPMPAGNPA